MDDDRSFWWVDTQLCVRAPGTGRATVRGRNGRRIEMQHTNPDWAVWAALLRTLKGLGFTIDDDRRVAERYPSLRAFHRQGRRGDLEWCGHTYPVGCEINFFQEIVRSNPNGGRYDFDRLAKMLYRERLSFLRARRALEATLLALGIAKRPEVPSPNPDPLAFFNAKWNSDADRRRGTLRFERDESGWPSARELRFWDQRDADGVPLTQGAVRYARDRRGYLQRGRVYGGINGMWLFVHGPGPGDFTHAHAGAFFAWRADLPRKQHPEPKRKLRRLLDDAVKAEAFERAVHLRDALRRLTPSAPAPSRELAHA